MAQDHFKERNEYELLAGYYSPVSDAYNKEGLAKARHRVKMCELAVDSTSDWLMVDSWESRQVTYQRTAIVLDHFDNELNIQGGGIKTQSGKSLSKRRVGAKGAYARCLPIQGKRARLRSCCWLAVILSLPLAIQASGPPRM